MSNATDSTPDAATKDAPGGFGRVRRRRGLAAAALALAVLAVLAVAAIVLATSSGGSDDASADSPSLSTATTTIKRQDLVEIDSEDGTLGYADSRDIVNHLSGVLTWLPSQGAVIRVNHALYRVDGSPVILLNGRTPAYRTLSSSTSSGRDVGQLESNLRRLGYDDGHDMVVDGDWDSGTTAAVERWQDDHGFSQNGSIELGRVAFQPGVRRVSSVDATLGGSSSGGGSATGSSSSASSASTSASTGSQTTNVSTPATSTAATQLAATTTSNTTRQSAVLVIRTASPTRVMARAASNGATAHIAQSDTSTTPTQTTTTDTTTTPAPTTTTDTTTTPAPTSTTPTTPAPAPTTTPAPAPTTTTPAATTTTPATSAAPAQRPAASAAAVGGGGGGTGGSATSTAAATSTSNTIMTTTSTRKVVTIALATTKSSLAKVGAKVTVEMPSGNTVHGRVTSIGKVATSATSDSSGTSSSSDTATINVSVRLNTRGTALDQAPVSVLFEQNRVKDVLAIPVTALLAQAGGKFAVELVDGSSRRLVPVTPGIYTSGFVQITGNGLQPGQSVTNAEVR